MKKAKTNARWLDKYGHKYTGKFIALHQGELVATGDTLRETRKLIPVHLNLNHVIIFYIPTIAEIPCQT